MKKIERFFSHSTVRRVLLSLLIGCGVSFLLFYIFLPPITLRASGFYVYLTACIAAFLSPFLFPYLRDRAPWKKHVARANVQEILNEQGAVIHPRMPWYFILVLVLPLAFFIVGSIFSSTFFFARSYAGIVEANEYDFATDMPESNEVTHIALMDTDSARVLGNRVLGSLSDMVSQYVVSDYYTQINFQQAPKKVSTLEYDGFFKWLGNRNNGIPGMVMVDPVKAGAEYMPFPKPIIYSESAFFGQDLERKLRFSYPTKIFDSISFEVDDAGHPYYIVSCAKPQVSLFGAHDITEVILFDPTDGTSEIMPVEKVPAWVDIVYTGELAMEKYNWHGTLAGGFLNSIIGNVGCKMTTDNFGYVVIDDDVWYFTGVTSVVSNDKSNIGFVLTNARTGEYKFYPVIGAEEHSAMAAAEGEVQEKGYVASFPSLISIAGQPTYIMVLKDDAGVVKLYALVNVENYSLVATGSTQAEAMSGYKTLLRQNNVDVGQELEDSFTVADVHIVNIGGTATVYLLTDDGVAYKGFLDEDESLILISTGDAVSVTYTESDVEGIRLITSWKRTTAP